MSRVCEATKPQYRDASRRAPGPTSDRRLWAWVVLLAIALLAVDVCVPLEFNAAIIYVGLVLLSLWSPRESFMRVAATAATCLAILGLMIWAEGRGGLSWPAIVNRAIAIAALWGTAGICLCRQRWAYREFGWHFERERGLKETDVLRRAKAELDRKNAELDATKDVVVYTLAKLAESRDADTGQHLERLRAYSQLLAIQLRKDPVFAKSIDDEFVANLYRASPLHDIGKVGIRDELLLKSGRLTPEEFELVKRHTTIGGNLLDDAISRKPAAEFLKMASVVARCHHERCDGRGYPLGLSGAAIPLAARIVALADVFDALTTERPYKSAFSAEAARDLIRQESGRQFDRAVVDAFLERFNDFVHIRERYPDKHVQIFGLTDSILSEVCSQI